MLFREDNIIHLVTSTLPGPELQSYPVNSLIPMHMGLHLLNPEPLPGTIQNTSPNNITANPWRNTDPQHDPTESPPTSNPLDTNSKCLEYHLDSALATALAIQTSGISSSTDILSPRAHNTLKALNALVSMEMPVSDPRTIANDPPALSEYVKRVIKQLRIPQPSEQDTAR